MSAEHSLHPLPVDRAGTHHGRVETERAAADQALIADLRREAAELRAAGGAPAGRCHPAAHAVRPVVARRGPATVDHGRTPAVRGLRLWGTKQVRTRGRGRFFFFHLLTATPAPLACPAARRLPRPAARATFRLAPLLRPNALYRRLAAWLERAPRALRLFTAAEKAQKEALFGCRMCGQCALPVTGYACPMTCPKQLRNGPCGGVAANGDCEVHPGQRCVWVIAYERAESAGHGGRPDRACSARSTTGWPAPAPG